MAEVVAGQMADRGEETRRIGPFRPGPGRAPPYLAGRRKEQALFRGWGGAVARGAPAPSEVVLFGPPGSGKTALLAWLQRHLKAIGGAEVLSITPADIPSSARFAEQLLPDDWWSGLDRNEASRVACSWHPGRDRPPGVHEAIRLRVSRRPLALLLDEAQTLDPELGHALLNASQQVGAEAPFFLVLAGTPALRDRLSEMRASFWHRWKQSRLGRLDDESSAAAVGRPFRDAGLALAAPALDQVVIRSEGHPYFLQVWGDLLWERTAARGGSSITVEDVETVAPGFEQRRHDDYRQRCRDLEQRQFLPAARAVADALSGVSALPHREVADTIRWSLGSESDGRRAYEAMTVMEHLGVLCQPGPTLAWEPGIPSLMDYIREHAPAP